MEFAVATDRSGYTKLLMLQRADALRSLIYFRNYSAMTFAIFAVSIDALINDCIFRTLL